MKAISKMLLIVLCFIGLTGVTAQQRKPNPERIMKMLDKNGKVSLEEFNKRAR